MPRFSSAFSGYVAACAAGGLAAALSLSAAQGWAPFVSIAMEEPGRLAVTTMLSTLFVGFFLFLTIWPASIILGSVAYVLRIQGWLYYVLGGIATGFVGAWLVTLNPETLVKETDFSNSTAYLNMAIGALMAFIYWVVAVLPGTSSSTPDPIALIPGTPESKNTAPDPAAQNLKKSAPAPAASAKGETQKSQINNPEALPNEPQKDSPEKSIEVGSVSELEEELSSLPREARGSNAAANADPSHAAAPASRTRNKNATEEPAGSQRKAKKPDMPPPKSFDEALAASDKPVKKRKNK